MEEIARGAEAVLVKDGETLVKERLKKGYRLSVIDDRLRTERTKTEARLLDAARRAGVPTPVVRGTEGSSLRMDFIEGAKLRDVLDTMEPARRRETAETIGQHVGRLHRNSIVHGDLTTSNMILSNELYFIDFGLGAASKSVEDRAVDLYLLHNTIKSTHYAHLREMWLAIIRGYSEEFSGAEDVLARLKKIQQRGRYALKVG